MNTACSFQISYYLICHLEMVTPARSVAVENLRIIDLNVRQFDMIPKTCPWQYFIQLQQESINRKFCVIVVSYVL